MTSYSPPVLIKALIRTMRPRQWVKNVLIFIPLVFDEQFDDPAALLWISVGFVFFCLVSSAVYILNDLSDLEADRSHPVKRERPLASGELPLPVARWAAFLLLVISFIPAYLLSWEFSRLLLVYLILNLGYSIYLKHVAIVDVFILASFYVLRVFAGLTLIEVANPFSPWLFVVTTLLALFIGFGKRRAELALMAENAANHRRVLEGYTIPLLDQYLTIISATTIAAYSLYTFSAPNLPGNHYMMLTIPFAIYGILRYFYLVQIKQVGGAPEEELLSDRPLQIAFLLWGLAVIGILYFFD